MFKLSKKLVLGLVSNGGRNFLGRLCVFHRGSGNKNKYRLIDRFRRTNQTGLLFKVLKDPIRTAYIGLIFYENGMASYIVLSDGLFLGDNVYSGLFLKDVKNFFNIGSCFPIIYMNLFTRVNNIELFPLSGSKIARSAGVSAYIIGKDHNDLITLKLNSGWQLKIYSLSMASLGVVSNPLHMITRIGKAGKKRALGFRPIVRGVIKNPCDHPHGGGEGKGSPPVAQVTPWGKLTKGTPTKNKKKDRTKRRLFKNI